MDVDIYGPNVTKMLGIEGETLPGGPFGIEPFPALPDLKAMSMAFLLKIYLAVAIKNGSNKTIYRRCKLEGIGLFDH